MGDAPFPDERPEPAAVGEQEWDVDQEWLEVAALESWGAEIASLCDGPDDGVPHAFDDDEVRDEELLAVRGPVSEWDLPLLASIDPTTLSLAGRMDYLRRCEAVEAMIAARKARAVVSLAGTDASDSTSDRHVAMDVAQLRRVGEGAACTGIALARALHVEFPAFRDALEAGEVSEWHCRVLVAETAHVTEPIVIEILQRRLLPKAKRKTPSEFRRDVRKAVADLDAAKQAERHALARADRYVSCTPLPNGMGHLGIVSDWPTISAMHERIRVEGRALQLSRGGAKAARSGDEDAFADASRADAFAAIVLGTTNEDGSITFDPTDIPVSLTLVMDLPTLRGEVDRHALLNGEPIPADVAREYAGAAKLWRRAVTDPVTGHLLDYGRERYLPEDLRCFILARDLCRAPGCTTEAMSQLEMDHPEPYPHGPSSSANAGGLCRKHHQLKTQRYAHLLNSAADGSVTWLTSWGQRIHIPPRPFLHDPADEAPPPTGTTSPPPETPEPPGPPTWPGGDVRPPWRDADAPPF